MALGLGTVQFGQAYGVSNRHGQVPSAEAAAILALARDAGIATLDTAANYGEAETVLAALDTTGFRIITKTIGLSHGLDAVLARARQSAMALKADTLLVHAVGDLKGADGDRLWQALVELRGQGVFRRIGLSAYVADDPVGLGERFRPDVMQIPFSLLDQRLLANGSLARLKALGVELHARSLFLQGLLFLPPSQLPEKLKHAAPQLTALHTRLAETGLTPLAAALGFVLAQPQIDVALVGVTSRNELADILAAAKQPLPDFDWQACALNDEIVLTPSRW
jgi:aryl-alcohol dehydrogenase-like predicted oxidoreductase